MWELLGKIPMAGGKAQELAHRMKESLKNLVIPGVMFEELGFKYYGPIDGHDLAEVVHTLEHLKHQRGPVLVHAVTEKGKGYPFAPTSKTRAHGVSPAADPKKAKSRRSYTEIFGEALIALGERDPKVVAITAAMPDGTGTGAFGEKFPDRFFDVGIAEQHAVTFAAGLACEGMKPVVAIYSTFLQRAYDQVIHDVALQKLPVVFAIDRAGLVGSDGVTHQGSYDLSFLRCVPNMVVMAPADENECRQMLYTATTLEQPSAVRFPRGQGPGVPVQEVMTALPVGRAQLRREGRSGLAILAFGTMVAPGEKLAEREAG